MDEVLGVLSNVTRVLAILGGGLAAVTVCFAGFQFMTGAGDPNKMSQARMSLLGTVGGLILVGIAFIIPKFVAETVTDPVGGVPVVQVGSGNCDEILRSQLVFQTAVSRNVEFQAVVDGIQSSRPECRETLWAPVISDPSESDLKKCVGVVGDWSAARIGGQYVPASLRDGGESGAKPRGSAGRDADNNILVHFRVGLDPNQYEHLPSDGSICWMYLSRLGTWLESYWGGP